MPTFVLIVGGQEWQRVTGMQEESTLRAMLAQIPRAPRESHPARRSVPVHLADDENKKFDFHLPLPPFASKKSNSNSGMVQIDAPNSGPARRPIPAPCWPTVATRPAREPGPRPDFRPMHR